ncbi:unnamed protein product [Aphanomyces euteiches]
MTVEPQTLSLTVEDRPMTQATRIPIRHNRWQSSPNLSFLPTPLPPVEAAIPEVNEEQGTDDEDDFVVVPPSAENIRAFVRIKPSSPNERTCLEVDGASISIASHVKSTAFDKKTFSLDGVLPESCRQEDVFESIAQPLIANVLDGYNGTIFAYGQTGSGKTHTMQGELGTVQRGVIPRILEYLFRQLEQQKTIFTCACSYLEIYNEKIFDLLDDRHTIDAKLLREDAVEGIFVQDLLEVKVRTPEDALDLLEGGRKNRTVGATAMNRESSRSHSVFTIKLIQRLKEADIEVTRKSTLHLVDLAGSEKQCHTGAVGARLKEASQINKSLSALGNVITHLVDVSKGLKRHIHYRDSKLTFLLRDALGGNSKTTVIATVSADDRWFNETLSTLQFVQRVKYIKNNAKKYEDDGVIIARLEKQVRDLQAQLDAPKSPEVEVLQQKSDELSSLKLTNEKLELVVTLLNGKVTSTQEELHSAQEKLNAAQLALSQATAEVESLRVKQTLLECKLSAHTNDAIAPLEIPKGSTEADTISKLQDIVAQLHAQLVAAENARVLAEKRVKEQPKKSFSLFRNIFGSRKDKDATTTGKRKSWWQRRKKTPEERSSTD